MNRKLARTAAALFDSLEGRRLLTTLIVSGGNNDDTIRLSVNETQILVSVNGGVTAYNDADFDSVSVSGGVGNDFIYIDANGANPTIVNGDSGADTITLGGAIHRLDPITAAVIANSSDGVDSLVLDDTASEFANDQYGLDASGMITRGGTFGSVTETGFADTTVRSGDNKAIFRVFDTPATGRFHLVGGAGNDQFDIKSTSSGATVFADGRGAFDELILNIDQGKPAAVTFENDQDFRAMDMYAGGTLHLTGTAGLYLSQNISSLEGDITLDRGFIIEKGSEPGGLEYYRDRLRNGPGTPSTGVPRLYSPYAVSSSASDGIGYGYAQNVKPTTVNGFPLSSGDLLMRYTLLGDADLNQRVEFEDLLALARNYGGSNKVWTQGDFDLDADVDFNDLLALAKNYGQSAPAATSAASTTTSMRKRAVDDVVA